MNATTQRNQPLDALRCIAVLLVVGFHLPYYRIWGTLGWIGVDLFFVLSGFLISGLLFQEYKKTGAIRLRRFLIRRGLKIYPAFYLLIGLAIVQSFLNHSASLRHQAFISAVFLQGYYQGPIHAMLSHTWSIAVEEHFYLFLPLLLILLITIRRSRDRFVPIPALFGFLFVICFLFRWFTLPSLIPASMTHMRMDSLFAGVNLGYLYHYRRDLFDRMAGHYALAIAFLCCAPAAFIPQREHWMQTFGLSGLLLGFSFLVAWAVARTPKSKISRAITKAAAKIGYYSYSIYLWHTLIVYVFLDSKRTVWVFWAYLCTSIVVGIAMAHLVEIPYLAVRDKLFPACDGVSALPNTCPSQVPVERASFPDIRRIPIKSQVSLPSA